MDVPVHLTLPRAALDTLAPMHLQIGVDDSVVHAGPVLAKLVGDVPLVGTCFFDLFKVERPLRLTGARKLADLVGARVKLRMQNAGEIRLKGSVVSLGPGAGYLVDCSFGMGLVAALTDHGLTISDFAQSDQIVEMLYLAEANAAVMAEARRLIGRLETSRNAAEVASLTDGLTGLGNRRALELWGDDLIAAGRTFALFQLDLDYFKAVNDTHGHAAGDAVLVAIARRLQAELRPRDRISRVGGDEFVVLLEEPVERDKLARLAKRLITAVEEPVEFEGLECRVSASVGMALSTQCDDLTLDGLMHEADAALYEAKRGGRGQARQRGCAGQGEV